MKDKTSAKGKAKSLGTFAAGTVLGLAIGATTTYQVASYYQNVIADQAVNGIMSDTHDAIRLRQGHQTEIAERIAMNFPNDVMMIDHEYKNHPMATKALQNIKFYYQKNNVPVPANIQPILGNVPK